MANEIQLKRSSVPGKAPDAANVLVGEPVVNLADGIIFTKNGSGNVIQIGAGSLQSLEDVSNTSPITNQVLTWTGSMWGPANVVSSGGSGGSSVTTANAAPGSATSGDMYWDTELGKLFIYYNDGDSTQWVEASPSPTYSPYSFSVSVSGSPTLLYNFSSSLYRGAKFVITLNNSPNYKIQEILLIHDGANVSISDNYTTDNEASIGTVSATYTANISGGNVRFYATAVSGSPVAKGDVTLIGI